MAVICHPESEALFTGPADRFDGSQGEYLVDPCELFAGTRISTAVRDSMVLPSFDFETYSEAGYEITLDPPAVKGIGPQGKGGLPVVGTPVYVEHPSADILSLYYDLKDGRGRQHWRPGLPTPSIVAHVAAGGLLEAWNITFEWWVWNMIGVRKYGWPPLPLEQCYCAMAKSRRYSLPGKLDLAAAVLGTPRKDPEGDRLIRKFTRPHKPTKTRPEWRHPPRCEDFEAFVRYNAQDVVAEDHASAHIPDLTPWEREWWLADQLVNARGMQVDIPALDGCLRLLGEAEIYYNGKLADVTSGAVTAVSQVDPIVAFCRGRGVPLDNLQAETVEAALKNVNITDAAAREVLEIREALGSANVKKLYTLKRQVNSDGRLRDQYMFCGADRTGRASAGGVQMQNITAKGPKTARCEACDKVFGVDGLSHDIGCPRCQSFMFHTLPEWTVGAVCQALEDIQSMGLYDIIRIWGSPVALLCGCLRGLFIAREHHRLICCDFSAIEAVSLACLARCTWRISVFQTHGKIYEQSAANATGIPFNEILQYKREHGMHHPARKTIGKVRELAGGYGGWVGAWKAFGADEFMTDDAIKTDVLKWRSESPEIVEMWGGQYRERSKTPELYGLEGAFISAVLWPGHWYGHIDIGYFYDRANDVMLCRLPSGRLLHYHRPRLQDTVDKLQRPAYRITFEGYNSNPAKGRVGWIVQETYGGRLTENVNQAVAADIQFEALVRVQKHGYPVVLHTHDELCAEVPNGHGSVEEMEALMSQSPDWAQWWPIKAAGWEHHRYQKD